MARPSRQAVESRSRVVSIPIRCKEFVGRATELAHLVTCRRRSADRHGGTVLVAGEAGIGKTRLVDEFVAASSSSTALVVRATCREFAQSPFGPLIDVVAQLGQSTSFFGDSSSEEDQLHALLEAVASVSARRTIVVIVEDLHWASREVVLCLYELANAAEHQRALFVLTYRDSEIDPSHTSFIALGKIARGRSASFVALKPFDHDLTLAILAGALDAGMHVPHVVLDGIARRSEGIPLFAEEMLRHAIDGHVLSAAESQSIPISLQAVVRERIARCSPRERDALDMIALFERSFDRTELMAFAGWEAPSEGEIATLVDQQLLVRDVFGGFRFRHALTRDVIYSDIPERTARPIHRRIADALEITSSPSVSEIAYHRWQSGDFAKAAAWAEAAGALARSQFAYPESIRWYERAIIAYGESAQATARIRLELGKALVAVHEIVRGLAAYEAVVAWARDRDVPLFVRARRLIAGTIANDGRTDEAIALLRATRSSLDAGNGPLSAGLTIRIASCCLVKEDTSEARRELAPLEPETLDIAQRAELYLLRSSISACDSTEDATWRSDSIKAVALYREIGSAPFVHYAEVQFAMQAFGRGNLRDARAALERAERASLESASSFNELPLSFANLENSAGNLNAVRTWLARVRTSPQLTSRVLEKLVRIELGLAEDDVAGLSQLLDVPLVAEAVRADPTTGLRLGVATARALFCLDRISQAHSMLERIAPHGVAPCQTALAMLDIAALRPNLCTAFRQRLATTAQTPFIAAVSTSFALECGDDVVVSPSAVADAMAYFDFEGWALRAARVAELAANHVDAAHRYRTAGNVAGLRRLGLTAFRSPKALAAPTSSTHLTARERDIARLVAIGKSNRIVANDLSLSHKTIEKSLTVIYAKLGVQSRAQLAAYVTRASGLGTDLNT
jgi:DNA-binding CsgD family transcriptional regulator